MSNPWANEPERQSYDSVMIEVDRLYSLGEYDEAFQLLDGMWPGLPTSELHPKMRDPLIYKAFSLVRLGRPRESLDGFAALIRAGYSCNLQSAALSNLRVLGDFSDIERENDRLTEEARRHARLEYRVALPEGYDPKAPHPVVFALHGDGDNMDNMIEYWPAQPMLARGFIVVYVQSSQLLFTEAFAWLPEPEVTRTDIRACYDEVRRIHAIDPDRVFLCGFSGGAIATVDVTFDGTIPVAGFICLCPEIKPERFTEARVAAAARRGVRGIFLEGDAVWPLPDEKEMLETMREAGMNVELLLNKDIGHAVPEDFEEKLGIAFDFLLLA